MKKRIQTVLKLCIILCIVPCFVLCSEDEGNDDTNNDEKVTLIGNWKIIKSESFERNTIDDPHAQWNKIDSVLTNPQIAFNENYTVDWMGNITTYSYRENQITLKWEEPTTYNELWKITRHTATELTLERLETVGDWKYYQKLTCQRSKTAGDTRLTVVLNSDDAHIFSAINEVGDTMNVYGRKDENGIAETVELISVTNASGQTMDIELDENERPVYIEAFNGVTFELEWLTETKAVLVAFDPTSNTQVNTIFDLEGNDFAEFSRPPSKTRTRKLNLKMVPDRFPAEVMTTKTTGNQQGMVTVKICGTPNYPKSIYFEIKDDQNLEVLTHMICKKGKSPGTYSFVIPSDLQYPSTTYRDLAKGIANAIGTVCNINTILGGTDALLCTVLGIAAGTFGGILAVPVVVACTEINTSLDKFCLLWDISNMAGLTDMILEADFLKKDFYVHPLRITAYVNKKRSSVHHIVRPADGPFTWEENIEEPPTFRSFVLSPSYPHAGQDYEAIARFSCLPLGSTVTISVHGTDGYEDFVTETISESNQNTRFVLAVPGAETNVRDRCVIVIRTPSGGFYSREAILVFGK